MSAARGLAAVLFASLVSACRNGTEQSQTIAIVPSPLSAAGCTGPDQTFTPLQTPSALALSTLAIGPTSQICAAGDSETLYVAGDAGQVVAIDVSAAPVETELVQVGTIAALLTTAGVGAAPELVGIAVLDADSLLVADRTSHTLIEVSRTAADTVSFFAGSPGVPGFADGPAFLPSGNCPIGSSRFSLTGPVAICPSGPQGADVFVADPGNHAVRVVSGGCVATVAGLGSAAPPIDGPVDQVGFDTPSGLSVRCSGTLLVTESGAAAVGGHVLRQIVLGQSNFFSSGGTVETLAGDGSNATVQGNGLVARLAAPVSVLATSDQDVYWIDSSTGILRRMRGRLESVDCPLWNDCASSIADFTPGGVLSLTQTPAGLLFVLDADAQVLARVTP